MYTLNFSNCDSVANWSASQNKLRRVILRSELLKKAAHLEGLAYATPDRNRLIGTPGHQATIDWIKSILGSLSDYYTFYEQPISMSLGVSATLTTNDKSTEAFAVGLAPSGDVSGPLVYVPNLGCATVSQLNLTSGFVVG